MFSGRVEVEQSKYLIYGKDHYVVRNDHGSEIAALVGLERALPSLSKRTIYRMGCSSRGLVDSFFGLSL